MKNHIIKTLIILLLFSGCSPLYYSPNTQNVPMITDQGEKCLTFAAGSSNINNIYNNVSTLDLQSAYGLTNHLAVQLNGGFYSAEESKKGDSRGTGSIIETGLGYFSKINNNLMFECYGIFGSGKFKNKIEISKNNSTSIYQNISGSLMRFGIQPAFAYKSKSVAVALSSRMVRLEYRNVEGYLLYDGIEQVGFLKNNHSYYLIEPALSFKFGWKKTKFLFQYGRSFNLSKPDFRQGKDIISFGLNFNFK
jgi:hypothetical protein